MYIDSNYPKIKTIEHYGHDNQIFSIVCMLRLTVSYNVLLITKNDTRIVLMNVDLSRSCASAQWWKQIMYRCELAKRGNKNIKYILCHGVFYLSCHQRNLMPVLVPLYLAWEKIKIPGLSTALSSNSWFHALLSL